MLGWDALAHDAPGDGHELAVQVLDALRLDPLLDLGDLLGAPLSLDEGLDVGHCLPLASFDALHVAVIAAAFCSGPRIPNPHTIPINYTHCQ